MRGRGDRHHAEAVQGVVDEISAAGKIAHPWALDLADGQATETVIEEIAEYFGGVDLLINNAGISIPAPIDHADYGHAWERSLAVLLTAHTCTIRAALPWLRESDNPRIVTLPPPKNG